MTGLPDRPDSPDPRELRASDADRERVAQVLREAAGDGRLNLEELDERLTTAYTARTYAELEPLTRDLPLAHSDQALPGAAPDQRIVVGGTPTSRLAIAIMSESKRRGPWTAPGRFSAFAWWGGVKIDLREARFSEKEIRIRTCAIMGGIDVFVPEDVEVVVRGFGIMGAFEDRATGPGVPGAPKVIVSGFAFWGAVNVKRRARKLKKQQELAEADDD